MSEKFIKHKLKWSREGRLLQDAPPSDKALRLPPGQHEVKNFPVLDLGQQPSISAMDWRLKIYGLVSNPQDWTMSDFLEQPMTEKTSDIHCVTSWSRLNNRWRGVASRHILSRVKPLAEANFVMFHSYDGYNSNIPLSIFAHEDVLLAHMWEGKALERKHGGPVRVVIPQLYFWKSAKWLKGIELISSDKRGFWEERGYHNDADPWLQERYSWQEKD